MKLMKYTFRTPLLGSIDCSGLFPHDDVIELSSAQMCKMYCRYSDLDNFLREHEEVLTAHVPDTLKHLVLRAEFGDVAMLSGKLYLRTYIWADRELSENSLFEIEEWISGQMSDGWGEGMEMLSWMEEHVDEHHVVFNEDTLEFEEDADTYIVEYYARPNYSEIVLEDYVEQEVHTSAELVLAVDLPSFSRRVVKASNLYAVHELLEDIPNSDLVDRIRQSCTNYDECACYLLFSVDENNEPKLLPKWICQSHNVSRVYNEVLALSEYESISSAILDLLA